MNTRAVLYALALLAAFITLRPAFATDQDDIRKVIGKDIATCQISTNRNWAMVDVGSLDTGGTELVLLRRYKGEWRTVPSIRSFSPIELNALGMPEATVLDFGLGTIDPDMIRALQRAVEKEKLAQKNFNVVGCLGCFYGYTSAGDPKGSGMAVWVNVKNKWTRLFDVKPNTPQADVDALFEKNGISRFIEYRIITGKGNNT